MPLLIDAEEVTAVVAVGRKGGNEMDGKEECVAGAVEEDDNTVLVLAGLLSR